MVSSSRFGGVEQQGMPDLELRVWGSMCSVVQGRVGV